MVRPIAHFFLSAGTTLTSGSPNNCGVTLPTCTIRSWIRCTLSALLRALLRKLPHNFNDLLHHARTGLFEPNHDLFQPLKGLPYQPFTVVTAVVSGRLHHLHLTTDLLHNLLRQAFLRNVFRSGPESVQLTRRSPPQCVIGCVPEGSTSQLQWSPS